MKLYSKAGQAPHYQTSIIDEDTGATVAVIYHDEDGSKGALLASAPDLLEALEDCLERLAAYRTLGMSFPETEAKARAAIAKATQA